MSLPGSVPKQGAVPVPPLCRKMLAWVRLESPHLQTGDNIKTPLILLIFLESMQKENIYIGGVSFP